MGKGSEGLSYFDFTNQVHHLKKDVDTEDLLRNITELRNYQNKFPIFQNETFFIIDYTRERHILLTGNVEEIVGYHPQEFLQNGLAMVIDIFHKDDFAVYNRHIYSSVNNVFQQSPAAEHNNYVFDFTYRMRTRKKKTICVLQRSSYITDPVTSKPIFSYGTCMDITPYKNDNSIIQKISKFDPAKPHEPNQEISTDYFYPESDHDFISKREREVLKWIAEGLSTKQIAAKLKISPNTIMNQRKSMLRKTNAKNVAELIRFAIDRRVI